MDCDNDCSQCDKCGEYSCWICHYAYPPQFSARYKNISFILCRDCYKEIDTKHKAIMDAIISYKIGGKN